MKTSECTWDLVHVTTVHRALDSRIFYRQARTAHKAGLRVAVVGPHDVSERIEGIQVFPLRKCQSRLVRRLFLPLSAFCKIMRLRPRIVHFHDPEIIPVAILLKVLGFRVIWDVHEYYSQVQTAHMKRGVWQAIKRTLISLLVEKWPCAFFDRSVFPTNSLRVAIWESPKSIACVNLLPVDEFPDENVSNEKDYDLIFMGSMSTFRAGPFMEMVSQLTSVRPDFKAALLGVNEMTRQWMIDNAPSQETLSAMKFLPFVPHAEVANVLRRARIGFNYHPMQKRFQVALPMKVYEYMACGIPVVCSRFPELADQLCEGEIVFVDGDDPANYADAVNKLLSDPQRMEEVGRMGNAAVRTRLNWEQSEVRKLEELYYDLLGRAAKSKFGAGSGSLPG